MGILANTSHGLKKSTSSIGLLLFRVLSGLVFAYTLSLIGRGLLFYGDISFWLVLFVGVFLFLKLTQNWGYIGVLVLDLVLFLVGLLLRMYVMIAPGA